MDKGEIDLNIVTLPSRAEARDLFGDAHDRHEEFLALSPVDQFDKALDAFAQAVELFAEATKMRRASIT